MTRAETLCYELYKRSIVDKDGVRLAKISGDDAIYREIYEDHIIKCTVDLIHEISSLTFEAVKDGKRIIVHPVVEASMYANELVVKFNSRPEVQEIMQKWIGSEKSKVLT